MKILSMNLKSLLHRNLFIYFSFLIIALAGIFVGRSITNDYADLRIWEFSNLLFMLIGLPFLFLQTKAGLPDFITETVTYRNRVLYPAIGGLVFGLLDVIVWKIILHPQPYTELPPFLQPFPYSIFLYFSGAFEIEVFYRLIPLTIILVIGNWWKKGKYFQTFFWAGAAMTALREPLEQLPDGNAWLISYSLLTGFFMNLMQAVWYKKAGFIASLSLRLGHYVIWHIVLGMYVEIFELGKF
ncbi:MAG: hypothetical protein JNM57_09385 [Cyclobacteriaceae bacterium]|nr:hypothetical protein [Cyclobacteriaceae bacterium]